MRGAHQADRSEVRRLCRVAQAFGRRRTFRIGLTGFVLASAWCGLSFDLTRPGPATAHDRHHRRGGVS